MGVLFDVDKRIDEMVLKDLPIGYALHQFVKDEGGNPYDYVFLDVNPQYENQTGLCATDILGKRVTEVLPEIMEDDFDWINTFAEVAYEGKRINIERYSYPLKKWFRVQAYSPEKGYFVALVENITEKDLNKESFDNVKSIFDDHPTITYIIDPETGSILYANKAALDFYGYTNKDILNMSIQHFNLLKEEKIKDLMKKARDKSQAYFTFPHRLRSGEVRMVEVYSGPITYGNKTALLSAIVDVTEKEESMKEIKYLAYHDYLTGAYNRRYFENMFSRLNEEDNYPISVILADINGLKIINESYGYKVGDMLIKKAADEIKSFVEDGIVTRLGGDEFAVLFTKKSELDILSLTNKLEDEMEKAIKLSHYDIEVEVYLSISFGYGSQNEKIKDLDGILNQAEAHVNRRKFYNNKSIKSHMIKAMMSSLFLKSEREKNHSERVSYYCVEIAKALNWDGIRVNRIRVEGVLHDIGKIGIAEAILNKPGKLDEDEWVEMKMHPVKGAMILKEMEGYEEIADVVLSHHERLDGKGYPNGQKGNEITIESRIIAIADAYDAMVENRPYRESLSQEEAIAELVKCSGTQFDPDIVDVFINKVLQKQES